MMVFAASGQMPDRRAGLAELDDLLRAAAERTMEAIWRRIGAFLDRVTHEECAKGLADAGYLPN
jgi:hypothetical protein